MKNLKEALFNKKTLSSFKSLEGELDADFFSYLYDYNGNINLLATDNFGYTYIIMNDENEINEFLEEAQKDDDIHLSVQFINKKYLELLVNERLDCDHFLLISVSTVSPMGIYLDWGAYMTYYSKVKEVNKFFKKNYKNITKIYDLSKFKGSSKSKYQCVKEILNDIFNL